MWARSLLRSLPRCSQIAGRGLCDGNGAGQVAHRTGATLETATDDDDFFGIGGDEHIASELSPRQRRVVSDEKRERNEKKLAEKRDERREAERERRDRERRIRVREGVYQECREEDGPSDDEGDVERRAREMVRLLDGRTYADGKVDRKNRSASRLELERERAERVARGETIYRPIIYNEGELDASDLTKPPSSSNPHPFCPSHLPPERARTLAPFVNHRPLLQILVDLGVDLFEVESSTRLSKHLVRLTPEEVQPKMQWLVEVGIRPDELGEYLTRNPFFLIQDLDDMKARVNYLESKRFSEQDIAKLVKEFRYWLNVDVRVTDARLGWLQRQFALNGEQVRGVIRKEPRVLMFGLGPLQRIVNMLNKEMGFSPSQMKKMLMDDPRLFMMDPRFLNSNFHYVRKWMRLSLPAISQHPLLLRSSLSVIRSRHEFLRRLNRAHYEGEEIVDEKGEEEGRGRRKGAVDEEGTVPAVRLADFLAKTDKHFCRNAANTYVAEYDKFLRHH